MSLYVDKKYTSKNGTPLAWHTFNRFVRCPLGVILTISNLINLNYNAQASELLICLDIMYLISIGLQTAFFIGSFNWKRYAYKSIIISEFYGMFLTFCVTAITSGSNASSIGSVLGTCIVFYFEYVYYKKREELFNDSKYDNSIQQEYTINENLVDVKVEETKTQNIQNDKPLFCRKCGRKLDPDSLFCRKCGTKVGEQYEEVH